MDATPTASDFTVTQSIDGGEALNVTPTVTGLDSTGQIVTLSVPPVESSTSDQSVVYNVSFEGQATVAATAIQIPASILDVTAPVINSIVAPNLTISGGPSTWNIAAGTTSNAVIGSIDLNFNENIKKSAPSDIALRIYSGNKDITPADTTNIKNLLFANFGKGASNGLSGNINLTYSSLKTVMNLLTSSTVTSVQVDVSDLAGNVTTLTLNLL